LSIVSINEITLGMINWARD